MEEQKKTEAAEIAAAPEVKKTTRKRTAAKKTAEAGNKTEVEATVKKTTRRKSAKTTAKKEAAEVEAKTVAEEVEASAEKEVKTTAKKAGRASGKTTAGSAAKAETKTTAKTAAKPAAKTTTRRTAAKKKAVEEPISPFVTEMDQYLFGMGTHYEIYRKLGAHPTVKDGVAGVYFAVWAPNAEYVSILGNFNEWNSSATPMTRLEPMGIWEAFVPELKVGEIYKYYLHTKNGWDLEKADPFASSAEVRPGTASRVAETENFKWTDNAWMNKREQFDEETQEFIAATRRVLRSYKRFND